MKHFESQYKDFEQDSLIDGKPVQLSEYGGDVIKLLGTSCHPGSSIQNALQFGDFSLGKAS